MTEDKWEGRISKLFDGAKPNDRDLPSLDLNNRDSDYQNVINEGTTKFTNFRNKWILVFWNAEKLKIFCPNM